MNVFLQQRDYLITGFGLATNYISVIKNQFIIVTLKNKSVFLPFSQGNVDGKMVVNLHFTNSDLLIQVHSLVY